MSSLLIECKLAGLIMFSLLKYKLPGLIMFSLLGCKLPGLIMFLLLIFRLPGLIYVFSSGVQVIIRFSYVFCPEI